MVLFLVTIVLAQEIPRPNQVDWTEYNQVTRKLCKTVRTKQEYGATLLAQLIFMSQAELALISGQRSLLEMRMQVHMGRISSLFAHEAEALRADATITHALVELHLEQERVEERMQLLQREVEVYQDSVTPRGFPKRVLKQWCRSEFEKTRDHMQHTLDVMTTQDNRISTISLTDLATPSY